MPGVEPRQRPPTAARIKPLQEFQEDSVYQLAEVGRPLYRIRRLDRTERGDGEHDDDPLRYMMLSVRRAPAARVCAEMPRPDVTSNASGLWGGWDVETLRIGALARSILIKLNYCHVWTPNYCLRNRSSCRRRC